MKTSQKIKTTLVACLFAVPIFTTNIHAQIGVTWNPGSPDPGLWSDINNWGGVAVPVSGYKAFFNVPSVGAAVVDGVAGGCQLSIGDGGPGTVIVQNGGNLTAGDEQSGNLDLYGWTGVGTSAHGTLIVENGGNVKFAYHAWLGSLNPSAQCTFIMNGGTASVTNDPNANWQLGHESGAAPSVIQMNGGTLYLGKWDGGRIAANGSHIDIAGGKIIVTGGDRVGNIQAEINAGRVTAYGGAGTFNLDFNVTTPGMTTLSASGGGGGGDVCATINDFNNSTLGGTYGSWGTPTSTPTSLEVTAAGFGGGFAGVSPAASTTGDRTLALDVNVSNLGGNSAIVLVVLEDGDGSQKRYTFNGVTDGHHVLTAVLSSGADVVVGGTPGFNFSTISFFHLQVDYPNTYTVAFNDLSVVGCDVGTPPSQLITGITVSGGNVTITYQTTPNFQYHIERSSAVAPTSWSTVSGSSVTAGGSSEMFTFPAGGDTEYYRISAQ